MSHPFELTIDMKHLGPGHWRVETQVDDKIISSSILVPMPELATGIVNIERLALTDAVGAILKERERDLQESVA